MSGNDERQIQESPSRKKKMVKRNRDMRQNAIPVASDTSEEEEVLPQKRKKNKRSSSKGMLPNLP